MVSIHESQILTTQGHLGKEIEVNQLQVESQAFV